jgi:hypothetical protein
MQEILPDSIIVDLYANSLVIVEENTKSGIIKETPIIKPNTAMPSAPVAVKPEQYFLGDNGKKITILVNEADAVYLNDRNLEFLTKILGACKLNLSDVAIINIKRNPMLFAQISKELNSTICLMFNVTTEHIQLPFSIPHYQVQPYNNCQFLLGPSLEIYNSEGEDAKLEKTKLWLSLKKIFNL